MGLLVLVGGLAQTGIQVAVRVPIGLRPQRRATAEVFRSLASGYGDRTGTWSAATARAIDAATLTLRPVALIVRRDAEALRGMVDEARRIRLELVTIEGLSRRLPDDPTTRDAVDELRHLVDRLLRGLADALVAPRDDRSRRTRTHCPSPRSAPPAAPSRPPSPGSPEAPDPTPPPPRWWATSCHCAASCVPRSDWSVRPPTGRRAPSVPSMAQMRQGGPPRVRPLAALRAFTEVLSEHLTPASPAFRHAVRLAVVVPLLALVGQHLGLGRSYWIPLSAAVVLRPDFAATMTRGVARVVGSVVGVGAIGAVLAVVAPGAGRHHGAGGRRRVGRLRLRAVELRRRRVLPDGSRAPSGQRGPGGHARHRRGPPARHGHRGNGRAGGLRAVADLVPCPGPPTPGATRLVPAGLRGGRAGPVHRGRRRRAYGCGRCRVRSGSPSLRDLARSTRLAYTDAQAAVARSLAEPPSKRIDADLGPGLLAALRRVTRAVHGLRTEPPGDGPVPGGAELASAVDAALVQISDALGSDRAIGGLPPLRTLYHRVEDACAGETGAGGHRHPARRAGQRRRHRGRAPGRTTVGTSG